MKNFTDEKTLLREIKNGNGEAFEFLFNSYYPRLRGYAARFVTDEEAVRDIIQESFLRFWEKRDLIEAVSISSLLFAMVRNACLNYLKHLQLVEQHNLEHLDRVVGILLIDCPCNRGRRSRTLANQCRRNSETLTITGFSVSPNPSLQDGHP